MSAIKKIRKRLDEITKELLGSEGLSEEEYEARQAELKTLRELIAAHKAAASFEEDYGSDFEEGGAGMKRTSNTTWD